MSTARNILLGTPLRKKLTLLAIGAAFALLATELFCQGAFLLIQANWRSDKYQHNFYFERSDDWRLAYQLRRDYEITIEGRRLRINKNGIRDDADDAASGAHKIAILGDSVAFGFNLDQNDTISAALQRMTDPTADRVKVLNFGTPGYALREYVESLRAHDRVYSVDAVVCILNPNDFTLRHTLYEGGDNGLNKMFYRPVFMTPYFVMKLLYRMKKGDDFPGLGWYQWIYHGTKSRNLPYLAAMRDHCQSRGVPFKVVIMPSGRVWRDGQYALAGEAAEIARYLTAEGIPHVFPVERFGGPAETNDGTGFYDNTDHFTPGGCEEMARVILELLGPDASPKASPAPPQSP